MLTASAWAWAIGADMLDVVSIATMMSARAGSPSRLRVLLTVVEVPATSVVVTGVGVSVSAAAAGIAPTSHRAVAASPQPPGGRAPRGRSPPRDGGTRRATWRGCVRRPWPGLRGAGTGSSSTTVRPPHPVVIAVAVAGVPVPVNRPVPREGSVPPGERFADRTCVQRDPAKRYPGRSGAPEGPIRTCRRPA